MSFSPSQLERYSRNIIVKEIGGEGQQRLLAAKVLVIGAGGLGSPLLYYLAAAGVGTLGIVDDDVVECSNLQRQILHNTPNIGQSKAASARDALAALNPDITIETYPVRLNADNAEALIGRYDIVADGSDNVDTRMVVNRLCYQLRKPLVSAAIRGFEGQLATFKAYEEGKPCYACLYPSPPEGAANACTQTGVLGAVAGVMGSLQATEVMKEIMGVGESMAGYMLRYDGLSGAFRKTRLLPDPACNVCGERKK